MSLNILISPRRELALLSSVPFTPLGKEASVYCYYCPLCMEFFESILKTKCCGNYICLKCSIEYLNAKGFLAESVKEIIGNSLLKSVNCPHCVTLGFNPQLVEKNDSIRDYSREVTGGRSLSCQCYLQLLFMLPVIASTHIFIFHGNKALSIYLFQIQYQKMD